MEEEAESPTRTKKIFYSALAPNKQLTLRKEIREELDIQPKDIVFLQVIKVTSPDGATKYEYKEDSEGE